MKSDGRVAFAFLNGVVVGTRFKVGSKEILAVGETMQVFDYSQFNWTMFNAEDRKMRRETVFPKQCQKAFEAGVRLAEE